MKYPKRTRTHQIETASWRLLQELASDEWIVREISERDYGIDAHIELGTPDGEVTGNLISVQLKGVEKLEWSETTGSSRSTRSPAIKVSTATYWFSLPVPVFLFVADLSARRIYYVAVQECIRQQFGKLSTQNSITFKLIEELRVGSEIGNGLLRWFIARERAHDQFMFHITNLLSHITSFGDFIALNQNRDEFMEVESERHLQFRALYETCRVTSLYFENEWKVDSLKDLYALDREQWKDECIPLHEGTLDYALRKLEDVFLRLVRRAVTLVSQEQGDYWRCRDLAFWRLCTSGELEWCVKDAEHRLGRS